ncbi:hypothetical protein DFH07DRAFT_778980 [Mycena maculata]|uniref:Uncharacterized protein n=1 Tax=Mycena maculata TaxID=230809 RepID=A0AAD7MZ23_9AGAR|nr:hypothetical protein DFH07DRAFT_778980 [Mycena maculata]
MLLQSMRHHVPGGKVQSASTVRGSSYLLPSLYSVIEVPLVTTTVGSNGYTSRQWALVMRQEERIDRLLAAIFDQRAEEFLEFGMRELVCQPGQQCSRGVVQEDEGVVDIVLPDVYSGKHPPQRALAPLYKGPSRAILGISRIHLRGVDSGEGRSKEASYVPSPFGHRRRVCSVPPPLLDRGCSTWRPAFQSCLHPPLPHLVPFCLKTTGIVSLLPPLPPLHGTAQRSALLQKTPSASDPTPPPGTSENLDPDGDAEMPGWEDVEMEPAPPPPLLQIPRPAPTPNPNIRVAASWDAILPMLEALYRWASHGKRPAAISPSIHYTCLVACGNTIDTTIQCLYVSLGTSSNIRGPDIASI